MQGVSFQRLSNEELIIRLAAIVGSCDEAIIGRDEHGTINTWNAAATRIFGYWPEDVIGQSSQMLLPPELQREEADLMDRLRAGERIDRYETQRLKKDGTSLDVSISVSPIRDPDGRLYGSALIIHDVGLIMREHEARARLAAIVESSQDAIVAKTLNGIVTDWNAAAESMFGYTPEEMVGRSILTIIPPELRHEEDLILAKIRGGQRLEHYETERVHKSGKRVEVSLSISPIRDPRGRIVGASKIARDISDRKAAERTLIEREKLAAAGRLAATLAHEVNNPLESITNLAYLISENRSLDKEAREFARLLLREVERAGDITRQTLSFYRESRVTGPVSVAEVLERVLRSKSNKFRKKHIRLLVQVPELPNLSGFAGELRQIFENLIENATDAVSTGGHIRIRARAVDYSDGSKLVISICDNGSGIAQERLRAIFDPFFTTKLRSGTGLGLWVTREIVKKHGGTIRVRSTEGQGSVFTVTLPLAKERKQEATSELAA